MREIGNISEFFVTRDTRHFLLSGTTYLLVGLFHSCYLIRAQYTKIMFSNKRNILRSV